MDGIGGEGEGTGVGDKSQEVSRLISLCVAESRSIHVTTDDSVSFLLWLSSIPCIHVSHPLYSFIRHWCSRLLPCPGYCKQRCSERWVYVSFLHDSVPRAYAQRQGRLQM